MTHKQFWFHVASYYAKTLPDYTLAMYADDSLSVTVQQLSERFADYRRKDRFGKMPLPAQLTGEAIDSKAIANDIARKIDLAAMKFGYVWGDGYQHWDLGNIFFNSTGNVFLNFKDCVTDELGEIAYEIIQSRGGWANIINSRSSMDEGTFIAQLRDQVESVIKLGNTSNNVTALTNYKKDQITTHSKVIEGLSQSLKMI